MAKPMPGLLARQSVVRVRVQTHAMHGRVSENPKRPEKEVAKTFHRWSCQAAKHEAIRKDLEPEPVCLEGAQIVIDDLNVRRRLDAFGQQFIANEPGRLKDSGVEGADEDEARP